MNKTFRFHIKLEVAQVWIEDGTTPENIATHLKEYLEEIMNPYSYEGEYKATIKVVTR